MATRTTDKNNEFLTMSESEALRLIALLSATLYNRRVGLTKIALSNDTGTGPSFSETPVLAVNTPTRGVPSMSQLHFVVDMTLDPPKAYRSAEPSKKPEARRTSYTFFGIEVRACTRRGPNKWYIPSGTLDEVLCQRFTTLAAAREYIRP